MTVSSPEFSPSRAGSLPLIADDLALDFANTESGRGFPSHQNHFRAAAHVVEWLRHANTVPVEEIGGEIRVLGHTDPQPVGLHGAQRFRVLQPFNDIRSLAEVVLMRGKAASGLRVGEIKREIVSDQRQRTCSGGGKFEGANRHLHLYKLWRAG